MKFLAIIPARYASTRLPGKPLANIKGKPMVQWTYENTKKAIDDVYVATDDKRIEEAVLAFGGKVVLTSTQHLSGTDRCAEAVLLIEKQTGTKYDAVINVQGDEPFIDPIQIKQLTDSFAPETELATLVSYIQDQEQITDPTVAKVVLDKNNNAILFSRSPIPFVRNATPENWLSEHKFIRHIGMYGYRTDILQQVTKLQASPLELAESLEQLRWLENGYKVTCSFTNIEGISVDTAKDLDRINKL